MGWGWAADGVGDPLVQQRRLPSVPLLPDGFTLLDPSGIGIAFTNFLAESRSLTNQIFLNGSGVAAGDVDGDGRCDVYWCGLDTPNRLYRNLGGWKFTDITQQAGVGCADQASTGAVFADVDGDGDLDLLVNGVARGTRLFLNDGQGLFREFTDESGLRSRFGSTSLALADVNGDGRLDLYVVNYRSDTMRDMPEMQFEARQTNGVYQLVSVNRRPVTEPDLQGRFTFTQGSGVLENGEADQLFLNRGGGRFSRVEWTDGTFRDDTGAPVATPYDWGLSALFRDLNGDGWPDLYVCNDFQSPDRIWLNDGRGRFQAISREAIRHTSLFSMGADVADLDRDGFYDIFVADMLSPDHERRQVQVMGPEAFAQVRGNQGARPQFPHNTLFWNRGDGTYAEGAHLSGVEASDWSWCPIFVDVDLDGFEDLLITTGHGRDAQNADVAAEIEREKKHRSMKFQEELALRRRFPVLDTPNAAFRNRGDRTFEPKGADWGFNSRRLSQGMALADLDSDGDLDVLVNCLNAPPLIYRNNAARPRVAVRLRGSEGNTGGVGAQIRIRIPGLPNQSQEMICGGRYLSGDESLRVFAGGWSTSRVALEVSWPRGQRTVLSNLPVNCLHEITEPSGKPSESSASPSAAPRLAPLLTDASSLVNHVHVDEAVDEFAVQPGLPRTVTDLGPSISWFDYNGDGWEDLLVGGGRKGQLGVYRNADGGRFVRQRAKQFEAPLDREVTSVLGWKQDADRAVLLMALANDEGAPAEQASLREFSVVTGMSREDFWKSEASSGPLALADTDGDGDLDVFLGMRHLVGKYPAPPSSILLNNQGERLVADPGFTHLLQRMGMVSAALFSDLDTNGTPDLVVACDWGPIRLFRRSPSGWAAWEPALHWSGPSGAHATNLTQLTGWWSSVTSGDFDGDGRPDLVAGNWGRNHFRNRFAARPVELRHGDTGQGGTLSLLESHWDDGLRKYVPAFDLGLLARTFPVLHERFPSFTSFSAVSTEEVLTQGFPSMATASAASFESIVLLNRGDSFEVRALPIPAQFAPIFGLGVGDLDGDGNQDVVASQNTFGVRPGESRQDAGASLVLLGDGSGQFRALRPVESGLAVHGEGRGVAVCDWDHDGRLDVAIGQHAGGTKLLRNARGAPCLRLRLTGGPRNPHAVGARVRAVLQAGNLGGVQEARLGNGGGSQDGMTLLLGNRGMIRALQVIWPNGQMETFDVPPAGLELNRTQPGAPR